MTATVAPSTTKPAPAARPVPQRLAGYDFTNLFISAPGKPPKDDVPPPPVLALFKTSVGVISPPPHLQSELEELSAKIADSFAGQQSFRVEHDGVGYRGEVIRPIKGRHWWSLRPFPKQIPLIHDLGFSEGVVQRMLGLGGLNGLVLFIGGTGDGKTTSASSLLSALLSTHGGIAVTVEDPAEMPLHGKHGDKGQGICFQEHWAETEFPKGIVSALRKNPDYIYIGEIRTPEAAAAAVNAALSGHLVISTVHGGNVVNGLSRLHKLYSVDNDPAYAAMQLAESVLCLVSQRLQRRPRKIQSAQWLFVTPDKPDAIRAKIREQQIGQLVNEIEQQAREIR